MPLTNIGSASASDLKNQYTDYSVNSMSTDSGGSQFETAWVNAKWTKWFGYYKQIPEINTSIDAKATWTVGKGFLADEITTMLLNTIKGWGNDTFNTILENMIRTYHIGGDAFCEIIRDDEGNLINLKPLDPGVIKVIVDERGLIKRYEQISKIKLPDKKFQPEQIFHLSRNRVADEIHGNSIIEKLENIILMRNEAMTDMKEVFHRFVKPKYIFHLDTDDAAKIAAFKAKNDAASGIGENMYIPKDAVIPEQISVSPNSTLNPLPWIELLNNYFYEAAGVPKIIIGNSGEFTEASAKISYLAFEQTIEEEQLYIEEEVLSQLNLVINLEFPASLENELLSDTNKDGNTAIQPNDTTAGRGQ